MKKKYIKLNVDDNHLSLGNLFRLVKQSAKNKSSAMQSEIFIALFGIENISDTTVNNYCVGVRGINDEYKQIYLNYHKKYSKDKNILKVPVTNLLSIIDGIIYDNPNLNESESLKQLCIKLYNISKNDHDCKEEFSSNLNKLITKNNLLEAISEILFFIILEKKQPLYEEELKVEIMENILSDTFISAKDLKEYLSIKLSEEVNFAISLRNLSNNGNAYACYELGIQEFRGYYSGTPRYNLALKYFEKAALSNHAQSYYMISKLYFDGHVGTKTDLEYEYAFKMATKAYELGCVAAKNELGLFYLNGLHPVKKDINKAIKYFEEAAIKNYSFSYNNLGRIYESIDFNKAIEYYKASEAVNNSWAANQLGEIERKNNNLLEAYNHYVKAIDSPISIICFFAYYNLAKYFYLNGCPLANVEKNISLAIEYFELASINGIMESSIELLYIYAEKYISNKSNEDYKKILKIVDRIEKHKNYDLNIKNIIEEQLKKIKENKNINLDIIK